MDANVRAEKIASVKRALNTVGGGIGEVTADDVNSDLELTAQAMLDLTDVVEASVSLAPVAEAITNGFERVAQALGHLDIDIDLGSAIERGLDSMGRDLKDGLESGLSEIAKEVREAS